jgi:hypothetical protein
VVSSAAAGASTGTLLRPAEACSSTRSWSKPRPRFANDTHITTVVTPHAAVDTHDTVSGVVVYSTANVSIAVVTAATHTSIDMPAAAIVVWTEERKRGLP